MNGMFIFLYILYISVRQIIAIMKFLGKSFAYTARKSLSSRRKKISQTLETINMKQVCSGEE